MKTSPSRTSAMQAVAASLAEAWAPACERIEIGGSIRRGKPDPHDIEIIAIPKTMPTVVRASMFDSPEVQEERNMLDDLLRGWKEQGKLQNRLDKNGRGAWGQRFKRCLYEGVAVDIFSVIPGLTQWGVIFAIRTGPADFSHSFVTSRLEGGFMPVGMQVKDGNLYRNGDVLEETPEEDDFFAAIGVPLWPPEERSLMRLAEWRRETR